MGFVAWGFCEVKGQPEGQASPALHQTCSRSVPPVHQVVLGPQGCSSCSLFSGLHLSGKASWSWTFQSCPLGATSSPAVAGAGRGDGTTMDTAIFFHFRLTPGLWVVSVAISLQGQEMQWLPGKPRPGVRKSSIPACPSRSHRKLGVRDITWCWKRGQLSARAQGLLFCQRERRW